MEIAIGLLGVALGLASLIWQAATHVLTGSRARVETRIGAMAPGGVATISAANATSGAIEMLTAQGFGPVVVGVQVWATGRMPVTVVRWGLRDTASGWEWVPGRCLVGPTLSHTIPAGGTPELWAVDAQEALALRAGARAAKGEEGSGEVVAFVELGSGRKLIARPGIRL